MQNHPNIFKNSGIRTKVNHGILQNKNLQALGYALGAYLHKIDNSTVNILIGKDTRPSGINIAYQLTQGLQHWQHKIFDAGTVPTPCIATALKKHTSPIFQFGIMITASHNPAEYNGLKLITPHGYLDLQAEEQISTYYADYLDKELNDRPINNIVDIDLSSFYQEEVRKLIISKQFTAKKIILDCAHGATYSLAKQIFASYGINSIMINDSSDGSLINKESGCSNPSLLIQALDKYNADFAFGFDGDGDRVIIVDKQHNILDGDDLLLLLTQHPLLQNETTLVGTILTNQAVEQQITKHKQTLIRTDVGERNLIQALLRHNALLATEPCGHITIAPHALCSDGIFAALLLLDTLTMKKISIKPHKFPQLHNTISLQDSTINDAVIQSVTKQQQFEQEGRVIARKSNTEPVLRIMIEHENTDTAKALLQNLTKELMKHIN